MSRVDLLAARGCTGVILNASTDKEADLVAGCGTLGSLELTQPER
jgi:hypothetical protein